MIDDQHRGHPLKLKELNGYFRTAQKAVGAKGDVAVRLVDDEGMRTLNRAFRGKDAATDVLSFPADSEPVGVGVRRRAHLGDLAVSLDMAARQAEAEGHSLDEEVRILLLHGLLHLAGYDHETDQGEMREREQALRRTLGLRAGLIERAGGTSRRLRKALR